MQPDSVDIDVKRAIRWLIASAVVVFVCGALAIVLPVTFPVGIAALLGWLFIAAAIAHLSFIRSEAAPAGQEPMRKTKTTNEPTQPAADST